MKPDQAGYHTVLEAVVGSQAYGLATADSDIDKLGIFVRPTEDFFGLSQLKETYDGKDDEGDYVYHEAAKYCRLGLKCNPTILELMWLTPKYESRYGEALREIRQFFLSSSYVRNAYLGYARQQYARIKSRSDGTFSSDTAKRTAKHARHLWRLCNQGLSLYVTGTMQPRLDEHEAAECRQFGDAVAIGNIEALESKLEATEHYMDRWNSVLPEEPCTPIVEGWLIDLRRNWL